MSRQPGATPESPELPPEHEPMEARDVLRAVWTARGQSAADLEDAFGEQKACRRMQDVGYDGLADSDADRRAAWREQLRREGKLDPGAGSIADLVLRHAADGR